MSDRRDKETLLKDILAESDRGDLREALLSRTLHLARRHRAFRQARRVGSALGVVAVLGFLVWRLTPPSPSGPQYVENQYVLVRTQRMPQSALVETQPLAPASLIASAPSANAATIATRPEDRIYREIDDAALLALAGTGGTNAAVLVRLGPHSAQLVFVPEPVRQD